MLNGHHEVHLYSAAAAAAADAGQQLQMPMSEAGALLL